MRGAHSPAARRSSSGRSSAWTYQRPGQARSAVADDLHGHDAPLRFQLGQHVGQAGVAIARVVLPRSAPAWRRPAPAATRCAARRTTSRSDSSSRGVHGGQLALGQVPQPLPAAAPGDQDRPCHQRNVEHAARRCGSPSSRVDAQGHGGPIGEGPRRQRAALAPARPGSRRAGAVLPHPVAHALLPGAARPARGGASSGGGWGSPRSARWRRRAPSTRTGRAPARAARPGRAGS